MVFAVYRSALAKLTKQKPTLEVVPPSGDSDDKEAAELSGSLLVHLWRLLRKPSKVPTLVGWLLVTGMTFIRVGWDPEAGESRPRVVPMLRPKTPLDGAPPMPGAEGEDDPDVEMEEVDVAADENGDPHVDDSGTPDFAREPDLEPMGEITWQVISPLAVRFNPEATSIDDADEMYVGALWPRKKAAKHFGVSETMLGGSDESATDRALYEDLMSATAAGFPRSWADRSSSYGVSQENAIGSRVLVVEYYAKSDSDFPDGRHFIVAGGRKVWPPTPALAKEANDSGVEPKGTPDEMFPNGEAPLPFGFWPPLVCIIDTPIPGQPTAVGVLPQVVPLNEQLNVLDGKIAEKHVVDSMGGAWIASPEDRGLEITSEPGQVIYSKAFGRRGQAFAPFQARMEAMPERAYLERDVITQKAIMVSGLSGLDLSQKPEGVTAGRAFLVMQETSDSVLMPTIISIESGLEESGRRELIIAQQKYTEQRTIAIRGEDGKYLHRSFINADLRSGHDVIVQTGSMFPWSKSAQWDARLQFLGTVPGLFTDMATGKVDEAKLSKFLDTGTPGLGAFESDQNPDLIEIEREHSMFEMYDPTSPDGAHQLPQIAFWQTHAIHLQEHYNFMKRDRARFDRWTPLAQQAFLQHMQDTIVAVSQMVAGAMPAASTGTEPAANPQDAGAAGGAPPPPPAPGGEPGGPPLSLVSQTEPPVPGPARLGRGDRAAAATA
jgi:hypothetical protein